MSNKKDYWISDSIEHKGALRRKAKEMGLIKGDEPLSFADLDKLEKLGGIWAKRANEARTLMSFNKKAKGGKVALEKDLYKKIATYQFKKLKSDFAEGKINEDEFDRDVTLFRRKIYNDLYVYLLAENYSEVEAENMASKETQEFFLSMYKEQGGLVEEDFNRIRYKELENTPHWAFGNEPFISTVQHFSKILQQQNIPHKIYWNVDMSYGNLKNDIYVIQFKNIKDFDKISQNDNYEEWIDPAGGIHYGDDDPSEMYKEQGGIIEKLNKTYSLKDLFK